MVTQKLLGRLHIVRRERHNTIDIRYERVHMRPKPKGEKKEFEDKINL